ncbi:nuclear transport factor 2 family protein [Hahella sp. KA22]|uniref:nuclear transport factor 2 family protein n=1 Tax=Hahella sp. KA22 TaxID=1628392 RepID=UPI000FDE7400|nr:nuclear transport factor 2 family protein [Hahella sp. KA22]AZZ90644.1 nuclear transport factor 2 family protein [Hahella sp. KA22]QAY54015.1 nuclear transport factor 2 family protein [Hahella sp. KA22]
MDNGLSHRSGELDFGQTDFTTIINIIGAYFEGLYYADTTLLERIFHTDAILKAPGLRRSLKDWLDAVKNRPVPSEQGLPYEFRLLSVEITGEQAMVKVACPLFEYNYLDYLGLLKENGQWLIVNKMYADLSSN